jgi:hypothetical protein
MIRPAPGPWPRAGRYEIGNPVRLNALDPGFHGVRSGSGTPDHESLDTLDPVQISMPDTSVADMASDGSFAVNYTGTGFAQWFGV